MNLGKTLLRYKYFKCDFENGKALYRSFIDIFGKIGRISSTDVIMHLLKKVKTKCLPAFYMVQMPVYKQRNRKQINSKTFFVLELFMLLVNEQFMIADRTTFDFVLCFTVMFTFAVYERKKDICI